MVDRVDKEEIKEIIRACAEDQNLRRIIFEIDQMDEGHKALFARKIDVYFFSRSSKEDAQAYRFFKFVLDDQIRENVIVLLKGG